MTVMRERGLSESNDFNESAIAFLVMSLIHEFYVSRNSKTSYFTSMRKLFIFHKKDLYDNPSCIQSYLNE